MDTEDTAKLLDILADFPAIQLAILHESMVTGNEKLDSNVYLAVLCTKALNSQLKSDLMQELALSFDFDFNVMDLRRIGPYLLGEILLNGQRLIGTDSDYNGLLSRYLIDKEMDFYPHHKERQEENRQEEV